MLKDRSFGGGRDVGSGGLLTDYITPAQLMLRSPKALLVRLNELRDFKPPEE